MEVRARYMLIGLFALAVALAGVAFVYWLDVGGGLASRTSILIRFDSPVAGLLKGSAVLFNGVRVGEVTALRLDASRPSDVDVQVAVDQATPVKVDTVATIDFQGLAGAPVVALIGGGASSPLLLAKGPAERNLTATKDAGQSLAQAGRETLHRLDTVVADNAASLKSAISSIDKFSTALARNSDKVDGILSGLERLTGGAAKPVVRLYDLAAVRSFTQLKSIPKAQLLVPEPRALANFETEKILVSGGEKQNVEGAQWPDMLPRVVQSRIVQSFENAGYLKVLPGVPDGTRMDVQLLIDIRQFQIVGGAEPRARVELAARLLDKEGGIVSVKTFAADAPAQSLAPEVAVKSLNEAFGKVTSSLVTWACEKL
jgi:phospholipid/cholesterol/gamma-HCH transport system substrate-binding protein